MTSLSAEHWPVIVAQPEVALELLRHAAISDAVTDAGPELVAVEGRPLGPRSHCAWSAVAVLSGLWASGIVPATVSLRVALAGVNYGSSAALVCEVADGLPRVEWLRSAEVSIGPPDTALNRR
jgi:hypothetical protein